MLHYLSECDCMTCLFVVVVVAVVVGSAAELS